MTTQNINCDTSSLSLLDHTQYQLIFSKIPDTAFFCQSIDFPGASMGTAGAATPRHDLFFTGDKITFTGLSANIIIDKNMNSWMSLYNWMEHVSQLYGKSDDSSTCSIIIGDKNFTFNNVFPVSISPIRLSSVLPTSEPITFLAEFNFINFEVRDI
jgi:hypothetical protein